MQQMKTTVKTIRPRKHTKTNAAQSEAVSRMSPKQAVLKKEFAGLKRQFLKDNKVCWVCATRKATSVHHRAPRSVRPDLVVDRRNFVAVCFVCHTTIHNSPKWAYESGWLAKSYDDPKTYAGRKHPLRPSKKV